MEGMNQADKESIPDLKYAVRAVYNGLEPFFVVFLFLFLFFTVIYFKLEV